MMTLIQIYEHAYMLTLFKLCVWIFKVHFLLRSRIFKVHCLLLSRIFKVHCLLLKQKFHSSLSTFKSRISKFIGLLKSIISLFIGLLEKQNVRVYCFAIKAEYSKLVANIPSSSTEHSELIALLFNRLFTVSPSHCHLTEYLKFIALLSNRILKFHCCKILSWNRLFKVHTTQSSVV